MFTLQDRFTGFIEDVADAEAQERILQGAYVLGHIEEAVTGPRENAMAKRVRQAPSVPARPALHPRRERRA